jgi:small-conductance mechanosensitive channel
MSWFEDGVPGGFWAGAHPAAACEQEAEMSWLSSFGLAELITTERLLTLASALLTLIGGLIIARFLARGLGRLVSRQTDAQVAMLVRRLAFYLISSLVVISSLGQLGIDLSVLLGAAGILTIAIGFASQTSASNLISGLFLMAERPFAVGDYVAIDDVFGEVLSIDLLSVKLRLFDNSLVRIPNENIIKTRLINHTYFPIRRVDMKIGVAYKEDVGRVKKVLLALADRNPDCLEQPKPQFFFDAFGDSALELRFCVWTRKESYVPLKNTFLKDIKEAFDEHGIEIPFPHLTLYTGSVTEPFPVRLVTPPDSRDEPVETGAVEQQEGDPSPMDRDD